MLKINQLEKSYGSKMVLKNITASFDAGNVYGVIGSNGAGKSTLFRCICGLENYKGTISHKKHTKRLKNHIAYLPTEPYFYPKITGKEYLEFYAKISENNISKSHEHLNDLFQLPLNTYIDKYSTGMKKKIAFLAILLLQRSIYILDEPFNGLDLDSVLLFKNIILELKNKNATVFVSSHIINSLTGICDTIQYLGDGKFIKKYSEEGEGFSKIEMEVTKDLEDKVSVFFESL